jgi:SAM-dependent methyltransferase
MPVYARGPVGRPPERSEHERAPAARVGSRPDRDVTSAAHFEDPRVVAEYASLDFLLPPEAAIFDLLDAELRNGKVLDLGVGGGRTAAHLLDRVGGYVGLDVSRAMIDACRRRFADRLGSDVRFVEGYARDLSAFEPGTFDVVLFAWQGIDSVGDDADRRRALEEIRRVCRAGAAFVFSTDNVLWARDRVSRAVAVRHALSGGGERSLRRRAGRVLRSLRRVRRLRRVNDVASLRGDRAMFRYRRPPFELSAEGFDDPGETIVIDGYVIAPGAQVRQLAAARFDAVRVFAPDGAEVTGVPDRQLRRWEWLYFLARAA